MFLDNSDQVYCLLNQSLSRIILYSNLFCIYSWLLIIVMGLKSRKIVHVALVEVLYEYTCTVICSYSVIYLARLLRTQKCLGSSVRHL